MLRLVFILFVVFSLQGFAQELNCKVIVNAQLTGNENVQVFKTLERQLTEFVNDTRWTNLEILPQERIESSMVITVQNYNGSKFQASIQVQSSRPVFNSTYVSPVYNFNDKDFEFNYTEYQNMNFSANQFESNLISVIAFHVYMILGLDADTFELNSGDAYYKQAQAIMNFSQQYVSKGWSPPNGGEQSRSALIDQVLSPAYSKIRQLLYDYHRNAMDIMTARPKDSKTQLVTSLSGLIELNRRRPNSFLLRVFFDAKADEIADIFSGGPSVPIDDLAANLSNIAPLHSSKWRTIKF